MARIRIAKSAAPKWSDYIGAGFEKGLHVFTKRIWLFALDVNRANHVLACSVEHGNNDLRPCRTKGCEITKIGRDVPNIDCFPGGNCHTSEGIRQNMLKSLLNGYGES
ncbi:MAG TPA: hypothetical protein VGR03_10930 [Candidatus Acidoferrum sp.]|nr:hypothetical protein [Candidatus Acidoferrum sp.]